MYCSDTAHQQNFKPMEIKDKGVLEEVVHIETDAELLKISREDFLFAAITVPLPDTQERWIVDYNEEFAEVFVCGETYQYTLENVVEGMDDSGIMQVLKELDLHRIKKIAA